MKPDNVTCHAAIEQCKSYNNILFTHGDREHRYAPLDDCKTSANAVLLDTSALVCLKYVQMRLLSVAP